MKQTYNESFNEDFDDSLLSARELIDRGNTDDLLGLLFNKNPTNNVTE